MYLKNLPRSEAVVLETAFKTAKNPREKLRFQAVWLLTQGYTRAATANRATSTHAIVFLILPIYTIYLSIMIDITQNSNF